MAGDAQAYSLYKTFPFDLDGIPRNERVAIYAAADHGSSYAQVEVYDWLRRTWTPRYEMRGERPEDFNVLTGHWWTLNKWVLILSCRSADESRNLQYAVLGYNGPELRTYIRQENLFMGDVWLERSQIVHRTGNQFWTWARREGGVTPILYSLPILPGAAVIVYAIQKDGSIDLSQREFFLPVGTKVQLLRKDTHPIKDRIFFPAGEQDVEPFPREGAVRLKGPGLVEGVILPGEDDWEKAVTLRFHLLEGQLGATVGDGS